MGVLVSFSTFVRVVALGFALGIVVGLYFGVSAPDAGSAACAAGRPGVQRCLHDVPAPVRAAHRDVAP